MGVRLRIGQLETYLNIAFIIQDLSFYPFLKIKAKSTYSRLSIILFEYNLKTFQIAKMTFVYSKNFKIKEKYIKIIRNYRMFPLFSKTQMMYYVYLYSTFAT